MAKVLSAAFLGGLAILGYAFEMASPFVLFPSDSLIVIVDPDESPPFLRSFPCGPAIPIEWEKTRFADGKTQYKAYLGGLSDGVWEVNTNKMSYAFLVVSPFSSLVEILVETETLVTMTTATGEVFTGLANVSYPLTFVVRPLFSGTEAWIYSSHQPHACMQKIVLTPNSRTRFFLPDFEIQTSSYEVVPGASFTLGFVARQKASVIEYALAPAKYIKLTIEPGWKTEYLEVAQHFEPSVFTPWIAIKVPSDAKPGRYLLRVTIQSSHHPEFSCQLEKQIAVNTNLSVHTVIGHWDVAGNRLDLTQPYALTYERILWAATLVGQEIPFTGVVMTQELFQKLAEEWASSAQ